VVRLIFGPGREKALFEGFYEKRVAERRIMMYTQPPSEQSDKTGPQESVE
jgi:hypothetical protein